MKLTKEQVEELAVLARLKLSPEEIERLAGEMTDILDYVGVLEEADTYGVAETTQVTGLTNVSRPDEIDTRLCRPDALLDCSELPKVQHQLRIKRMM